MLHIHISGRPVDGRLQHCPPHTHTHISGQTVDGRLQRALELRRALLDVRGQLIQADLQVGG